MTAIESAEIIKEGVGLLIPRDQSAFISIEERDFSESTKKIPGMRSMIFETVEPGETYEDAIKRALKEEVNLIALLPEEYHPLELCHVQLTRGIWLHAYLIPMDIPENMEISLGITNYEVANPGWDMIDDVLNCEIGSIRFRPGNREVLISYKKFLKGGLTEPDIYFTTADFIN